MNRKISLSKKKEMMFMYQQLFLKLVLRKKLEREKIRVKKGLQNEKRKGREFYLFSATHLKTISYRQ